MTTLHDELCKIYGTSDATTKIALNRGLGILGGSLWGASAWEEQQKNRQAAEAMTQAIRQALATRNAPIYEGFRSGTIVPTYGQGTFDDEMMHLASAIGTDLVLYKEAGIGNIIGAVTKSPTIKGLGAIGRGIGAGTKSMFGGIGRGIQAAPGAMKNWASGTLQRGRAALTNKALGGQYKMEQLGQRIENRLSGIGQRAEKAMGGRPKTFETQIKTTTPPAQKAYENRSAGRLETPSTGSAPGVAAETPTPVTTQAPSSTKPAPANAQSIQTPQPAPITTQTSGQAPQTTTSGGAQPPQQQKPPSQQQPPQQHATPQQPAPPPPPANPPRTGPSAQGAAKNNPAAPPPPPPTTPQSGQQQPVQTPQPVSQATPQQPTATTNYSANAGPSISPQQQQQKGFWDRSGLSGGDWKYKLPLLGLGALGSYGVYRAGKGAFNWMGQEAHPEQWGNPYAQPAATVNEWGYAQR